MQTTFAGHRLTNRDPGRFDKSAQHIGGLAVDHTATGDNQRLLSATNPLRRALNRIPIGAIARDLPDPLVKERGRIVIGFGLHILGQRQGHGTGFGWAGQHAHCFG